jgi:hypothetical protein
VYGKSSLYFKLQIFTKTLAIPVIITGVWLGMKSMIIAMIIAGFLEFLVKAYYSGRLIEYSVSDFIKDLVPSFLLALGVGAFLFLVDYLINTPPIITLVIQFIAGTILFVGFSELFKIREYRFVKEIILERLQGFSIWKKFTA